MVDDGSAVCYSENYSLALISELHMPGADQVDIGSRVLGLNALDNHLHALHKMLVSW
jgi:hypothetical protein